LTTTALLNLVLGVIDIWGAGISTVYTADDSLWSSVSLILCTTVSNIGCPAFHSVRLVVYDHDGAVMPDTR